MPKKKFAVLIAAGICLITCAAIWFGPKTIIQIISLEGSWIENLTALFYLGGFVICILLAFRKPDFILPVIWGFLCLLFFGEETSWLQRVFDYSISRAESINTQGEFNLHNLAIFQSESLFDSPFTFKEFLTAQNLFRAGFVSYFVLLPFFRIFPRIEQRFWKVSAQLPDFPLAVAVIVVFSVSFALTLIAPPELRRSVTESREMFYSLFILVYVTLYLNPTSRLIANRDLPPEKPL